MDNFFNTVCKRSYYCDMLPPNQHFAVSKDKWNTKEDTGKYVKNTLYILQYSKRNLLG